MWQGTYDMINTEYPDSLPEMDLSTHNMMLSHIIYEYRVEKIPDRPENLPGKE